MAMSKLEELKKHLRAGQAYRRSDLAKWSSAVDRHLRQLLDDGFLKKLSGGVYYRPEKTYFGDAPPKDEELVRAFLKDDHFYITSLNAYNSLGVGTTQLDNQKFVYNYKRDGLHELNGRPFFFLKRPRFPSKSTQEFLLVDMMNNLQFLGEDKEEVLGRVTKKARSMDRAKLKRAVSDYAGARAKSFFEKLFDEVEFKHAA